MMDFFGMANRADAEPEARSAALKAIELDPNLAEAHVALAGLLWFSDWDWANADKEYRRALELSSDSLEVCGCYTLFLAFTGRPQEALAMGERGIKNDPLSAAAYGLYCEALIAAHRYEDAITCTRRSIELNPQQFAAYLALAKIYEVIGRPQEALTALDRPEFRFTAERGVAYAMLARRVDALNIAGALAKSGADARGTALVYFALGDKDRGFEWLTRAFDERQILATRTKSDPQFDAVRSDPRFQALVARLKLPDVRL